MLARDDGATGSGPAAIGQRTGRCPSENGRSRCGITTEGRLDDLLFGVRRADDLRSVARFDGTRCSEGPIRSSRSLAQDRRLARACRARLFRPDRVYSITGGPILVAADAKTGKLAWRFGSRERFTRRRLAADGKLYVFNDEGFGQIITLDAEARQRRVGT